MLALGTKPEVSLKNIVVATDFSPASEAALDCAIGVARHYGSKILLVHAVETVSQPRFQDEAGAVETHRLAEAELKLLREAEKCTNVECERHLLSGTAVEVVEQFLAIDHTDLIVVGTHGTKGFRKLLMGSVADQIFRHVRCPVLAIGPLVREGKTIWDPKRILLATDLQSDESRSVAYATALATEHDARLALLHVTSPAGAPYPEDSDLVIGPYYLSQLRRLVSDWRGGGGYQAEVWVEFEDDAVAGIINFATRQAIDLLVLSVHPSAPWTLHFGHNAHRIITAAPCPVLIVQREL